MTTGVVRTTLITGAAQGLGFEIAQTLAHAGHQLVMVDQSPTLGAAVAKLPRATAAQLDVANENAVRILIFLEMPIEEPPGVSDVQK
jgi:NAD(P)-dependent dehydrogenase (short-subunit alcohol dehydrogenase family)